MTCHSRTRTSASTLAWAFACLSSAALLAAAPQAVRADDGKSLGVDVLFGKMPAAKAAPAAPAPVAVPAAPAPAPQPPVQKVEAPKPPPAPPAPAPKVEAAAPASTGGQGVTQFYGFSTAAAAPAWAAEARMNPDYAAAAAPPPAPAPAPAAAAPAAPAAVAAAQSCSSKLNATLQTATLHFRTASAEIASEDVKTLDTLAGIAKSCGDAAIEIGGHTDSSGNAAANKALSQARADAVANYLAKAGVPSAQLKAVGYGPAKPVASNDTADGRSKNRRIEFTVSAR